MHLTRQNVLRSIHGHGNCLQCRNGTTLYTYKYPQHYPWYPVDHYSPPPTKTPTITYNNDKISSVCSVLPNTHLVFLVLSEPSGFGRLTGWNFSTSGPCAVPVSLELQHMGFFQLDGQKMFLGGLDGFWCLFLVGILVILWRCFFLGWSGGVNFGKMQVFVMLFCWDWFLVWFWKALCMFMCLGLDRWKKPGKFLNTIKSQFTNNRFVFFDWCPLLHFCFEPMLKWQTWWKSHPTRKKIVVPFWGGNPCDWVKDRTYRNSLGSRGFQAFYARNLVQKGLGMLGGSVDLKIMEAAIVWRIFPVLFVLEAPLQSHGRLNCLGGCHVSGDELCWSRKWTWNFIK